MKQPKPYCPNCKGTDLDKWPDGYKFGYCYTCHESVTVVYPTKEVPK
jgi:hypothetical protein